MSRFSFAQKTPYTVDFQVTYDAVQARYTAWVVPRYDVPNEFNTKDTEFGGTAQFTLKVPAKFVIDDVQDIHGSWDKLPLRLGPGNQGSSWLGLGLDPNINYYVIGKTTGDTDYGSFKNGVPVALFSFKGNGCFGPVSVLEPGNKFIDVAGNQFSYNVGCSFYSRSGRVSSLKTDQVEQFRAITGFPAQCATLVANPDSYTLTAGAVSNVPVLANDTRYGEPVSASLVTVTVSGPATTGTTTINPDGTIAYTPAAGYSGPASFTYTICDKDQPDTCFTAPVSLTVNALLVAQADQGTTPFNTPVTVNVLTNDTRNGLPTSTTATTVSLVSQPANGTALVNANGSITYTPASGFSGYNSLDYKICDIAQPGLCSTASLSINVENTVVASADSQTLTAGMVTTVSVLSNDTYNGQPSSLSNVTVSISTGPASGTVTVNPNGTISYTPAPGFAGPVSFTYTICSNTPSGFCSSAPVQLTVLASPIPMADLAITKQVSQPVSATGSVVSFTITVQNNGPDNAIDVFVTDTLTHNNLVQLQGTPVPSKGKFDPVKGIWTVGNLTPGETVTLVLSVRLLAEGVSVNVASVTATGSQDTNLANNQASACTSVPYVLCSGKSMTASVPMQYQDVVWYRNGDATPYGTGHSILITQEGSYSVKASNNSCPIAGCCPIIVQEEVCCAPTTCTPIVIRRTK